MARNAYRKVRVENCLWTPELRGATLSPVTVDTVTVRRVGEGDCFP